MTAMRSPGFLMAAAVVGLTGCPGTDRDLGTPPKDAEVPPPDAALDVTSGPEPVRILTWNVHNLYNTVRDSPEVAVADEMIVPSAEYQTKLTDIAAVLVGLAPDIAVLQEVENQNVLQDLGDKLTGYPYRHITLGNDPRGIDIALLSRHPYELVVAHDKESFQSSASGKTYTFARDVLEAHFVINGRRLIVLGIHFKSGSEPFDLDKRLAEAEQTRRIALQHEAKDPTTMIVVLGDFNAGPATPPLIALEGEPPSTFQSVTASLQPTDRFSVTFGGTPQLFDDQRADPDAFAALDVSSVKIEHGSAVNAASDHDPVAATYVLE